MRTGYRAAALAMAAALALQSGGCPSDGATPDHGNNRAAPPDPAPHASPSRNDVSVHFYVYTDVEVVVTYNAGHGNKFIDSLTRNDDWFVAAPKGAQVYISATPAKRGAHGTIAVKAEGTAGRLLCHNTNVTNTHAGADCFGKAK